MKVEVAWLVDGEPSHMDSTAQVHCVRALSLMGHCRALGALNHRLGFSGPGPAAGGVDWWLAIAFLVSSRVALEGTTGSNSAWQCRAHGAAHQCWL